MSAARKKPLDTDQVVSDLSESAFFTPQPTSTQVDKTTSGHVDKPAKPQVEKYTTHLRPDTIEAIKDYAFTHKPRMKDYEVVQQALTAYLEGDPRIVAMVSEVAALKERLDIETRYRQDTEVRHFKSWIRSHSQPQDTDFFQRFQQDTRLPQHASRSMYEAKLRSAGYADEDVALFESAWKDMLFTASQ